MGGAGRILSGILIIKFKLKLFIGLRLHFFEINLTFTVKLSKRNWFWNDFWASSFSSTFHRETKKCWHTFLKFQPSSNLSRHSLQRCMTIQWHRKLLSLFLTGSLWVTSLFESLSSKTLNHFILLYWETLRPRSLLEGCHTSLSQKNTAVNWIHSEIDYNWLYSL